jgi:hypothetical protein
MRTWPFSGGNFGSSAGSLSQAGYMVVVFSEVPRQPFNQQKKNPKTLIKVLQNQWSLLKSIHFGWNCRSLFKGSTTVHVTEAGDRSLSDCTTLGGSSMVPPRQMFVDL